MPVQIVRSPPGRELASTGNYEYLNAGGPFIVLVPIKEIRK
jgi:hypothetical protein